MITAIEGILADLGTEWIDVKIGGITIRVNVPQPTVDSMGVIGSQVDLFTVLHVRDDSLTLFGFSTSDARKSFEALIGVNGVGPKVALSVLSALEPSVLALAVASGDSDAFKNVSGVGTRTAGRIILDLKGKLDFQTATIYPEKQDDTEVISALTSLGYSSSEAFEALASLSTEEATSIEEKVRLSLQQLAGE